MLPELISAGANIFSGFSASRGQSAANRAQMSFNAEQAQMDRDWQERMSNTAFQRSRKDLEAAGYNPILAFPHGASTPSGASASATPHSTTEESSRLFSSTAKQVSDIGLQGIMKKKAAAETVSAAANARVATADADAYTSMPMLAKIKAVLSSLPGVGSIASGVGLGAMMRNLSSAKGISTLSRFRRG